MYPPLPGEVYTLLGQSGIYYRQRMYPLGQCFVVCPQDAKQIVDETEKVKVLLQSSDPVIVSLAPSFIANYEGVGINAMREALKNSAFSTPRKPLSAQQ